MFFNTIFPVQILIVFIAAYLYGTGDLVGGAVMIVLTLVGAIGLRSVRRILQQSNDAGTDNNDNRRHNGSTRAK